MIALLDADDLWHPEKIARQLQTFADNSPDVGLVYCWYRMIDEGGRVTEEPWAFVVEGSVFDRHLALGFGTGSSPLIKRSALGTLRYSTELSRPTDGGLEDWFLQLQIASKFEIACTRAFLLGYRQRSDSMSADRRRMMRAHIHMYELVARDFPGRASRIVRRELARWHAKNGIDRLRRGGFEGIVEIAGALARAPFVAGRLITASLYRTLVSRRPPAGHSSIGMPFIASSPDSD